MDSVQQIYATNQTPLSQTFRASFEQNVLMECQQVQYGGLAYDMVEKNNIKDNSL